MMRILAATPIDPIVGNIALPSARFTDLHSLAGIILAWILTFGGTVALAAIVYSGFMYMTAAGNAEQAEKAKKNLMWAVLGVVLIALSTAIVVFVNNLLNGIHT
jgi:amino acid transporter